MLATMFRWTIVVLLTHVLTMVDSQAFNMDPALQNAHAQLAKGKETFDPSWFTTDIQQCHVNCGDEYFDCAAFRCVVGDKTSKIDQSAEGTLTKAPSFWSRFAYYFSFGLLGSLERSEIAQAKVIDHKNLDTPEVNQDMCERNCTYRFRDCYFDCVCKVVPNNRGCVKVVVFPQTLVPPMFVGRDQQAPYVFDWNTV